jgi:hypothetical protein
MACNWLVVSYRFSGNWQLTAAYNDGLTARME